MSSASIIGFGRFGPILSQMLTPVHEVVVFDERDVSSQAGMAGVKQVDWEEACSAETIFLSVPIRHFKAVVVKLLPYLKEDMTIIDVCSVKVYPVTVMKAHLPKNVNIIATHPLFGPDSAAGGYKGLSMTMHPVSENVAAYDYWYNFFGGLGLDIVEISPEEHDKQAARSQGITHFIGRVLEGMNLSAEEVSTEGFRDLQMVVEQTCNDSLELFEDLENYNPFTAGMIEDVVRSIEQVKLSIIRS